MAQHALPPGAIRRRAAFGLLDADGWSWAGIKALFWFLLTIFLLGYIPNLAYYFTVSNTVDVGYNFLSVVNWCPTGNATLPCPAPAGAIVPWQEAPEELDLPEPRQGALMVQTGSNLYVVGGTGADGAPVADSYTTVATADGNFYPWTTGPALPEARSEAALATLNGVPYVIGGLDASGDPTTTVYVGHIEAGVLTAWELADGQDGRPDLTLPAPMAGAAAASVNAGLYLMGGRVDDQPTHAVYRTLLSTTPPIGLGPWEPVEGLELPEPRADAAASFVGEFLYLLGGDGPDGPTSTVFRLQLDAGQPVEGSVTDTVEPWSELPASQAIPAERSRATAYTASGTTYIVGGVDASEALQSSTYWAIASTTGELSWHHLDQSDLPGPRADAGAAVLGGFAFIVGGETEAGPASDALRGNLAPAPPFFRLGIAGATLPALSIKGEIGQQIGYINAMTVGIVNFVILVLVAWAFSHRSQTMAAIEWISRGRIRAPREDEYTT